MSDLDEYQSAAMRTHVDKSGAEAEKQFLVYACGLTGEAGEVVEEVDDPVITALGCALAARVADRVKKHVGHGHELDREALIKELGDVLWYVAGLAHVNGVTLSEVARRNVAKLMQRYPNGFTRADSKARVDTKDGGFW